MRSFASGSGSPALCEAAQRARDTSVREIERAMRACAAAVQISSRSILLSSIGSEPSPTRGPSRALIAPVPLHELFVILIDAHGLGAHDAAQALAVELRLAGYHEDAPAVSPEDAIAFIEAILGRVEPRSSY